MQEAKTCKDCYYSKGRGGPLLCRRYPPSRGYLYPEVHSGEWCGEHEPKNGKGKRWQLRGTLYEEDVLRDV